MSATPIYDLSYFTPNMVIGSNLDMDKNRFTAIENQLFNIYNIFGNGIVDQYDQNGNLIPTWALSQVPNTQSIQISAGVGHIGYVYAATNAPAILQLTLPPGATSGSFTYYFYATQTSTTPVDQSVNFIFSLVKISDPVNYVGLGGCILTLNSDGKYSINFPSPQSAYGRQEISLLASLSSLVINHVHIGGPTEPSPIDLSKHVTGFLSSDNIDQLDLNKVTSGTLDPNRLPQIDHNSLLNIGTLTHSEIDSLLASLQYPGNKYNISDYGIVNRLQIILALKKQSGFFNIDGEQYNSIFYLPYSDLSGFVDTVNTTATVDTNVHRIYGVAGIPRQSNVIKIDTTNDFSTALFIAEDSIPNPIVKNINLTGINSSSLAGTVNLPYGMAGSANTIYISSAQDSYISSFSTTGTFINRRNNFDPNLLLNSPLGLWYDSTKNYLYIADTFNHRIIVTDGTLTNTYAKIGAGGQNGGGGIPGSSFGQFNFPKGVYGLGNTFYVSDSGNNRIQKFNWVNGNPIFVNAYYFNNYSNTTITGIKQSLKDPRGLVATSINNTNFLFVADYGNHEVLCGIETNNIFSVYQVLGDNSCGFGIFNTSLITYSPSATATGSNAVFSFSTSVNGTISNIGILNTGKGHSSGDTYIFNYPGQPSGLIYVLANSAGGVSTAYVQYGISTNNILGFSHPQGLAVSSVSNKINLLITDTDNNRVLKYQAQTGIGSTSNQFLYNYGFGTVGIGNDTNNLIYFARPAGIYAQQGFSTIFVSDSLNDRIGIVSTGFSTNILLGYGATSFGVGDTSLTNGGITLSIPFKYIGIANTFFSGSLPSNWYFGETVSQGTTNQSDSITRYNFTIFSSTPLANTDTIAISLATINEQFSTQNNLGQIDCYLIFDPASTSSGTSISFNLAPSGAPSNILISNVVNVRQWNAVAGAPSQTIFYDVKALAGFGTGVTNSSIIGFGFKWSTSTGWVNSQALGLGFYLPSFNATYLSNNFPSIYSYRQENGLTNSVFIFNQFTYASQAYFVYRFDSGAAGNASFDYAIFEYSNPSHNGNASSIQFNYRVDNTLAQLNSDPYSNYSYDPNLGIVSGEALGINASGRYIDLIFSLVASTDQLAAPTLSSISLYYSVFGQNSGIIYDTNITKAPLETYPRQLWSQGTLENITVTPVPGNNTQSYQLQITNTSNIGQFSYLSNNQLIYSDISFNETNQVDIFDLYYSPYQVFANLQNGLLNPQHYINNNNSGLFIADTDNDRILEIDSNGKLLNAIQGNIKLPRSPRDFVVLGSYYNTNVNQLYLTFSQYLGFANTGYITQLSVLVNGTSYALNDPTYFQQSLIGLWKANANNASAIFVATTTPAMNDLIVGNSSDSYFQIQNPSSNPPFILNNSGRSDNQPLENQTIVYNTSQFTEFVFNSSVGIASILNYSTGVAVTSIDPTVYGQNTGTTPSTLLFSYTEANASPPYANFYSIPIQVFPIYFDNIFKPIFLDYTGKKILVATTVGNNSVRAYDSSFYPSYVIGLNQFNFNEKLGGSAYVLDRSSTQPGNNLLIAQPSAGISTIVGNLTIYNRNTNFIVNQFLYNGFDAVKSIPNNNDYLVLLYDRQGNGLRSKLIQIGADGAINYSLTNTFTKPVSLSVVENGNFYVTDTTGQIGTLFFRNFVADGASTGVSAGSNGGTGNGGSGNGASGSSGGNFGGGVTGGSGGSGGSGGPGGVK